MAYGDQYSNVGVCIYHAFRYCANEMVGNRSILLVLVYVIAIQL